MSARMPPVLFTTHIGRAVRLSGQRGQWAYAAISCPVIWQTSEEPGYNAHNFLHAESVKIFSVYTEMRHKYQKSW